MNRSGTAPFGRDLEQEAGARLRSDVSRSLWSICRNRPCHVSVTTMLRSRSWTRAKASRSCWCTALPRTPRSTGSTRAGSAFSSAAGRRVIALDNRGHGASTKLYDPAAYHSRLMAADLAALLDHLELQRADVMGYSMGARIAAFLALESPQRLRSVVFGGLGSTNSWTASAFRKASPKRSKPLRWPR